MSWECQIAEISAPWARGLLVDLLGRPEPNPSRAATIPAIPTSVQGSPADGQDQSESCTHPARPPASPGSLKSGSRHHCSQNAPASALRSRLPFSPRPRRSGCQASTLAVPPPECRPRPGLLHLRKPPLTPGGPTRPLSGRTSAPPAHPSRPRPKGSPSALGRPAAPGRTDGCSPHFTYGSRRLPPNAPSPGPTHSRAPSPPRLPVRTFRSSLGRPVGSAHRSSTEFRTCARA